MNKLKWVVGFVVLVVVGLVAATGTYQTDFYGNYSGYGQIKAFYSKAADAGDPIAATLTAPTNPRSEPLFYEIISVKLAFNAEPTADATFTATIDSAEASAHDFTFVTQNINGVQWFAQTYSPPLVVASGDDVDFALTLDGADSGISYGLEVIYQERNS